MDADRMLARLRAVRGALRREPPVDRSGAEPGWVRVYDERGWAHLPGVFTPDEVAGMREESGRLVAEHAGSNRSRVINSSVREDRVDPVVDVSETFRSVAHDARALDAAKLAVGGPARLLTDKLITKPPGTAGYRLHQDYVYWQAVGVGANEMTSVVVALDAGDRDNGGIEVFPGRHRFLLTKPGKMVPFDSRLARRWDSEIPTIAPGDVLVLHPLLPHRSGANTSTRPRRLVFFTYAAARHGDLYSRYYAVARRPFSAEAAAP